MPDMALLIHAALHKLIGTKKMVKGVHTRANRLEKSLIEIAPAVWNIRYLQVLQDSILGDAFAANKALS